MLRVWFEQIRYIFMFFNWKRLELKVLMFWNQNFGKELKFSRNEIANSSFEINNKIMKDGKKRRKEEEKIIINDKYKLCKKKIIKQVKENNQNLEKGEKIFS